MLVNIANGTYALCHPDIALSPLSISYAYEYILYISLVTTSTIAIPLAAFDTHNIYLLTILKVTFDECSCYLLLDPELFSITDIQVSYFTLSSWQMLFV